MSQKNSQPKATAETAAEEQENQVETVEQAEEKKPAGGGKKKENAKPADGSIGEESNGEPELSPKEASAILEAILFCSEDAVSASRIRDVVPALKSMDLRKLVKSLNKAYEKSGRTFRIESVAGGFQLFTEPAYSEYIEKFYAKRQQNRLSKKALETLAIVAYKQPVTRTDIEEIRGVNADGVVRTLLMRGLITISGTAPTPGNPYLYKTTRTFLEYFGLKHIKDLPRLKELDEIVQADSELQEKIDIKILKEIAPESLGLDKAAESEDTNSASEAESTNGSDTEQHGTANSVEGETSGESDGREAGEDPNDNQSGGENE